MLNIQEILKISNDMGVEVVDSKDGKHYIFDDNKQKNEFDVDMLISPYKKENSYESGSQILNNYKFNMSSNSYHFSNCKDLYTSTPVNVNESMIDAA